MIVLDAVRLREKCAAVRNVAEGGEIARRLTAEMERINKRATKFNRRDTVLKEVVPPMLCAAGLAAPQIGVAKRVCVVKPGARPFVLMNPVIINHSSVRIPMEERCLNLPGQTFQTWRYLWVEVDTLNIGKVSFGPRNPSEMSAAAILDSVVAQHEVASLSGLLVDSFTAEDYPPPEEWEGWSGITSVQSSSPHGSSSLVSLDSTSTGLSDMQFPWPSGKPTR